MKAGCLTQHREIKPLSILIAPPASKSNHPSCDSDTEHSEPLGTEATNLQTVHVSEESVERTQRLLCELITSLGRHRLQLLQELQPALVKLVTGLVEQIVGRELAIDGGDITRVVGRALAELGSEGRIIVRTGPEDAQILRQAIAEGRWLAPVRTDLEVIADVSIARGGCVLHSDYGQIDATIQTQMTELRRLLTDDIVNGEQVP
jgi:flagellar biosynthesis/type III secretory pathway protein FliH